MQPSKSSRRLHKRWLIPLIGSLVLALGVYTNRERLERAVIAYRIHQARILIPPPLRPDESRWHRVRPDAQEARLKSIGLNDPGLKDA